MPNPSHPNPNPNPSKNTTSNHHQYPKSTPIIILKYFTHVKIGWFLQICPRQKQAQPHNHLTSPQTPRQVLLQIITREIRQRQVQSHQEKAKKKDRHNSIINSPKKSPCNPKTHRNRRERNLNRLWDTQVHARVVQQWRESSVLQRV